MIQYGNSFSAIWDGYRKVNKGSLISLAINATTNQYQTLYGSDFNSYQVPASYRFVIVGIEVFATSTSSTFVTFNLGYGDNVTTTTAPTNNVPYAGYLPATVLGQFSYLSHYLIVPASKYPYFRSTSANDKFSGCVIGYLEAV